MLVGFDEVFVKDQAFYVEKFLREGTIADVFPQGFVYSFIIRHPSKTIGSLYNGGTNFKNNCGECFTSRAGRLHSKSSIGLCMIMAEFHAIGYQSTGLLLAIYSACQKFRKLISWIFCDPLGG